MNSKIKGQIQRVFAPFHQGRARLLQAAQQLGVSALLLTGASAVQAGTITHNVSAANLVVVQNDTGNTTNSVTVTATPSINDLRVRPGSVQAIYNIQVGPLAADDQTNGLVMTATSENGRNNGNGFLYQMSAFATNGGAYSVVSYDTTGNRARNNGNCAVAYFPYTNWVCGWGRNKTGANGGVTDLFTGSQGVALGTQFKTAGGGVFSLDLRSLGINSTTDGVLLVNHAKDEGNFALSHANTDGTWAMYVKDNHGDAASYEQDPIAFVFVPRTNTSVISGKFMADGTITMFSGSAPAFAITNTDEGTYRLTVPGHTPADSVLITSPEGGQSLNQDNVVYYAPDNDGWLIYSSDINAGAIPLFETPTGQLVASFVVIPGPTPGVTLSRTNGLATTESGGADTFTVRLDFPPTAEVTINLTSSNPGEGLPSPASLTFSTNNWNVPQTVTVTGVDDSVVDGPITYAIQLSAASSTDPNYSGLQAASVTAVNADNDQAGITVTPVGGLVTTEAGGTATFSVRLNSRPAAGVTIGFASSNPAEGLVAPAQLAFDSTNWSVFQTVTVTGVDDFVVDGDIAYQIVTAPAVSADANYNGLKGANVALVNLDNDKAGIILSVASGASLVVVEGRSTNYTVVLTSSPVAPVTLHFGTSNPLKGTMTPATVTFTAANWNQPQTVTLTAVDNAISDGDFNYVINTTVTSTDPLYNGQLVPAVPATTVDNEPVVIYPVSAANVNVVQNDTGNNTNSVTVTATLSINDMRVRPNSVRGIYNLQVGVYASDDLTNGLIMSCVTEAGRDNGDGTFTYDMSAIAGTATGLDPGYSVVTYDTTANRARENGSFAVAYFTYANWICGWGRNSTAVNGGPTDLFTGSPGVNLGAEFQSAGGGVFSLDLRGLGYNSTNDGVLIVNHGKDEGNFALSHANDDGTWSLWVKDNHGDNSSYEQDPIAFVFVPRTNTSVISGKFMADGSIAMFSGATPAFAIATADTNGNAFGPGTYRLTIPGYNPSNGVLITSPEGGLSLNQDNIINYTADSDGWLIYSLDINATALPSLQTPTGQPVASFVFVPGPKPGFTVSPTNGLSTSESGASDKFTVVLNYPPTDTVTINLSSSLPTEGLPTPTTLTFTPDNWNVPQTVTVTGVDDSVVDGPIPYAIVLAPAVSADPAYSGLDPADVGAVNADNDQAGIAVTPTSGLVTTEAGGSATFSIRLNSQPAANVTIGLSSSNPGEGVPNPAAVTFTPANWSTFQTVTVQGVDDFVDDGTVAYQIVTAPAVSADAHYNGLKGADVSAANLNNDTKGVKLSVSAALVVVEGQGTNFTVVLNSSPVAPVTITFNSSNPAKGYATPGAVVFSAANWSVPQTVAITAPDNFINDGDISYTVTAVVTSADPLYAGLFVPAISATTIDNEPGLSLPSGDCVYTAGGPAVYLDHAAGINEEVNANYAGGSLTVAVVTNGLAGDVLGIRSTGTGPGQISLAGTNVLYGGVTMGSYTGGTNQTPLVVSLNAAATPQAAQALLAACTYRYGATPTSRGDFFVSVALNNGLGGVSTARKNVRTGLLRDMHFQQGLDYGYGVYTNENDISLAQVNPFGVQPSGTAADGLLIDWPDAGVANESQVLLRFDQIFGTNANQIPLGATVVSAELLVTMINPGQGGTLNRMLIPWDATNATWNNVGGGIFGDDVEAVSAYDSQLGNQIGTGTTGLGTISIGVTIDVQTWAAGATNYGWVLKGWPFNTDGTGFWPGEAPVAEQRPHLHVQWLPATTNAVSFRQGVNGYTNAFDTKIQPSSPNSDASKATTVFVDWLSATNGDFEQVLIRFDGIFGTNSGQVPFGAQIDAAMLDLASMTANSMGDGGQFYALLQPWTDTTSTWNSWNGGIQPDGVKAATVSHTKAGTPDFSALVQSSFNTFDVTTDVRSWSSGALTNYGWAMLPWPGGSDGWGFNTAEAAVERERPQLRIYYSLPALNVAAPVLAAPVVSATQVSLTFTGTPGVTYTVQRQAALNGVWTTLGTVTTAPDGSAAFTDTAPLAGAGFYRVVYP